MVLIINKKDKPKRYRIITIDEWHDFRNKHYNKYLQLDWAHVKDLEDGKVLIDWYRVDDVLSGRQFNEDML